MTLQALLKANALGPEDLLSAIFSATPGVALSAFDGGPSPTALPALTVNV